MFRTIATVRPRFVLLAVLAGSSLEVAHADAEELRASSGGSSWHWTPEEWTQTTTYTDAVGYADAPAQQSMPALTVEWRKPQLDALGNFCIIRGQLRKAAAGKARTQPVDWFQGVTVYLAMVPGEKPDWSAGMNQADTLHNTDVVSPSGEFEVQIDMRETQHDRTLQQSFQFGVALAGHEDTAKNRNRVVWSSRAPAIPATVQMLDVPAAAKLSRELGLINRASGWPYSNPNGVVVIQAVNALQRLGKQRALAILEEYVELTNTFDYHFEQEIVFWIVRVLFEPIRLDDRIPSPMIAVSLDKSANWPLNPMAIVDDIPFMLGQPPPWVECPSIPCLTSNGRDGMASSAIGRSNRKPIRFWPQRPSWPAPRSSNSTIIILAAKRSVYSGLKHRPWLRRSCRAIWRASATKATSGAPGAR